MEFAEVCLRLCAESVSHMYVTNNTAIGASGTLRFPPPYSVKEYICRLSSRLYSRQLSIPPKGSRLTALVGSLEC